MLSSPCLMAHCNDRVTALKPEHPQLAGEKGWAAVWIQSLQLPDQQRLLVAAAEPAGWAGTAALFWLLLQLSALQQSLQKWERRVNQMSCLCLVFGKNKVGGGYTSVVWIFNPLNLAVLLWSMVVTIGIMDLDDGYSYFTKGWSGKYNLLFVKVPSIECTNAGDNLSRWNQAIWPKPCAGFLFFSHCPHPAETFTSLGTNEGCSKLWQKTSAPEEK